MKEIKAIIQPFMLEKVLDALAEYEPLPGITISHVQGWGKTRPPDAAQTTTVGGHAVAQKCKVEIVVTDDLAPRVADLIATAARTGNPGDGKVFLVDVLDVVKIRTGERGESAL